MTTEVKPVLILRPKKSSAIWLLLGSGMFLAGEFWIPREERWIGYLGAGFFGLCLLVAVVQLLPGSTYLRIADDGLSFANLFRVTTIPWKVIDQFFVVAVARHGMTVHKMVAFNHVPSYDRAQLGRRICSVIAGCKGALPNTYGRTAEELAEILNRCLTQFKEEHHEQHGEPETSITRNLK